MTVGPGTRLGPYEIIALIGKGGFGEVFKARDTRLDRSVAIKVLPSADPDLRARFDREARAIAALQHPNICALHDVGHHDGTDYLVLEFLEGETLADRVKRGRLSLDDALAIAITIASALDRAHRAGIVHRDLKPENVMLTRSGPKLLDFGLAKLRPAVPVIGGLSGAMTATSPFITAQGTIVGTLHYMSPEQINGGDVDARGDIWAFGCVLYEMLTGQKAFVGSSPASLIAAIMSGVPPRAGSRSSLTPPSVDRVIGTCLVTDPDKRFQSAHDLGLQLHWIAARSADAPVAGRWPIARYAPWAIATVAILSAIVSIALGMPRPLVGSQDQIAFLVHPPEGAPFPIAPMFLTVSPDGRSLAFVAGEVGGVTSQRLYVRPLDETAARWLPGTETVDQPFWSADSRSIAYSDRTAKLMRIDVTGGPPRPIADVPGGQTLQGGTWNRNGDILFGLIGGGSPIFKVSAGGGVPAPVTTLDRAAGELAHIWPHFLPDGDHFLYTVPNVRPDRGGVFVASLKTPGATRVVDAVSNAVYSDPGFLLFVRDETLMAQRFDIARMALLGEPFVVANGMGTGAGNGRAAFAGSQNGVVAYRPQSGGVYTTTLTWLDRSGRVLGTVGTPNLYRSIAVSPDGTRVAAQIGWTVGSDIWVADVSPGIFTRLTSDPSNEEWPVWSRDGKRVAFASNRDGKAFNIYDMPADGSDAPRLLFESDRNKKPVQWSYDGRWLLFDANGVSAVRLDGDRTPIAIGVPNGPAEFARFSPDDEWIAYASDETGRLEVFLQRFPGPSARWRISSNGGTRPHWRADGRELYYLGLDNYLYAVTLTPGSPPGIGETTRLFPVRLTSAPSGATRFDGIEPAADGQKFLVNLAAEASNPQPVTVRVNWPAILKK